jgi:hypothetical protein
MREDRVAAELSNSCIGKKNFDLRNTADRPAGSYFVLDMNNLSKT